MRILIDKKGKKYLTDEEDLHMILGYIKKEDIKNSSMVRLLKLIWAMNLQ